jgi:hypothetical protein
MDYMNNNLYNMNMTIEGSGIRGYSHAFHPSESQSEQSHF